MFRSVAPTPDQATKLRDTLLNVRPRMTAGRRLRFRKFHSVIPSELPIGVASNSFIELVNVENLSSREIKSSSLYPATAWIPGPEATENSVTSRFAENI